jgi:pimeloyl-ACP methyl ester carboxylesterase
MNRIAAIVLACLSLAVSANVSGASGATRVQGARHVPGSTSLTALDPYLVSPNNLGNINLSTFLSGNPNLATYAAADLAADGTSAGILLFETSSLDNVTFSITSGAATLLPYAANFMKSAPQTGSLSLIVTSANFFQVNGHEYAAVLLQGPLGGYSSANVLGVSATQDNAPVTANLGLVMPPLVLVHGLWGDKTSLVNVQAYIDTVAPWDTQPQLVVPICYSLYIAFDATTDPLTGGNDPCEVTSAAAVQTEIDSLFATLDSEHIVGGRVDLAVHSMGGLVARNYASQSGYTSLRNRMQGQFHALVTLDTPEIGSTLANWLIAHRANKRKAPDWTPPGLLWDEVCGSSDVQTCFYGLGYPLAAKTLPIDSGAVYSLEPKGPSLKNPKLVGPLIPNATWRAVSATAPSNSALAFGLDTLIQALYTNPYGSNVPTLNSILGKVPNDAIVTVASQTKDADPVYTFPNLSHTSLVSSLLTWLSGDALNDNSVTDDPSSKVYALTACWLETNGADSCVPQEAENRGVQEAGTDIVLKPVDRIDVQAPGKAVLGKPFEIAVHLRTPGAVPQIAIYQRGDEGHTRPEIVAVTRTANDTLYARVTPKLPGPVTFGVRAAFSDGGVSVRQLGVNVVPTAPQSFGANDLPVLVMTLNASSHIAMPHPFAIYPAPVGRVDLDATFVTWRLLPQKGAPVVALQSNGLMQALAPAVATAEAHFGASVARLHIIVRATQQ